MKRVRFSVVPVRDSIYVLGIFVRDVFGFVNCSEKTTEEALCDGFYTFYSLNKSKGNE